MTNRIREIPYNYTSFSDKEIIYRLLGKKSWQILQKLKKARRTGRSARMLFEVLGDMWIVNRNPYLQNDLIVNKKRKKQLIDAMQHRLKQIENRLNDNQDAKFLWQKTCNRVTEFESNLKQLKKIRAKVAIKFKKYTHKDNIDFSSMACISHCTDATDWRSEYPLCVLYPDDETEALHLVKICIKLKLKIISFGAGTGYTGAVVPLVANTVVINTEKLNKITGIEKIKPLNSKQKITVINVGCGVITREIENYAKNRDLVFAVDPTSADASTIGGNIAMNAGGKKAVCYGTTVDNLHSWRMINPDGNIVDVERLNYIEKKIQPDDLVVYKIITTDVKNKILSDNTLKIKGSVFRKNGLGKDVTDKFLQGLPAVQKEGTDGLITSAKFVLHKSFDYGLTICMEFYGDEMEKFIPAIFEIKNLKQNDDSFLLTGLEHLDQTYLKAVNYTPKDNKNKLPHMILLADICANSQKKLDDACQVIAKISKKCGASVFVAKTANSIKDFWAPRSRTAAIAKHTNAFKLNEDVVIPLDKLAQYTKEIQRINEEYALKNITATIGIFIEIIKKYSSNNKNQHKSLNDKYNYAIDFFNNLNKSLQIDFLTNQNITASLELDVNKILRIFDGEIFADLKNNLLQHYHKNSKRKLFIGLHMHAGDGNVHTNIPVNSHDYEAMADAYQMADKIMLIAQKLGGVISGEHGIGLTKFQYLDKKQKTSFLKYKRQVDKNDVFNPGKLQNKADLSVAWTPSLQLLHQEALILKQQDLDKLNDSFKNCLRCGKCKSTCSTHVPEANLLYSPRNKILNLGLLLEVYLYESQTRRGVDKKHYESFNDISDHCTVCARCKIKCPVDINFADVTSNLRIILNVMGQKRSHPVAKFGNIFLNNTNTLIINNLKRLFFMSYKMQRYAHKLLKHYHVTKKQLQKPPATTCKTANITEQVIHFINRPLPNDISHKTLSSILSIDNPYNVSIIPIKNPKQSVFYFAGCGSEKLYPKIAIATIAMLREYDFQVVLPPPNLCCGYPQSSAGDKSISDNIITNNKVLFHRIATTLNYLDIKKVIVSCGTCLDKLCDYEFEKIFPQVEIIDIHEFLHQQNISVELNKSFLFHDPCHSPTKNIKPIKMTRDLLQYNNDEDNNKITITDRCCGESGTFAINRADISTQVKFKKNKNLQESLQKNTKATTIITTCPSCLQGLSRYQSETKLKTDYVVCQMAQKKWGKDWQKICIQKITEPKIDSILI